MHHDAPKTKRGEPVQTLGPEHKGASTQITNVVLSVERWCPSMRMTTDKMYYGNYRFVVEFDSGSETGSNQLTVWAAEKSDIDAVPHTRNFCRKFALDEAYRKLVLAGETRWARRNALFVRNLLSVVGQGAIPTSGR